MKARTKVNYVSRVTLLANTIGRPHGIRCVYEMDVAADLFKWNFYSGERRVGTIIRIDNVVAKMERLIEMEKNSK